MKVIGYTWRSVGVLLPQSVLPNSGLPLPALVLRLAMAMVRLRTHRAPGSVGHAEPWVDLLVGERDPPGVEGGPFLSMGDLLSCVEDLPFCVGDLLGVLVGLLVAVVGLLPVLGDPSYAVVGLLDGGGDLPQELGDLLTFLVGLPALEGDPLPSLGGLLTV